MKENHFPIFGAKRTKNLRLQQARNKKRRPVLSLIKIKKWKETQTQTALKQKAVQTNDFIKSFTILYKNKN